MVAESDRFSEVIAYHDETRDVPGTKFRGHVILLVPRRVVWRRADSLFGDSVVEYSPHQVLLEQLLVRRHSFGIDKKLHFSEISGRRWGRFDSGVREMAAVGVEALRRKGSQLFPKPLCCKLGVIFYPSALRNSMFGGDDRKEKQLRYDETILRTLLKGLLHYLYDDSDRVRMVQIVTDGEPGHRLLDSDRVVERLRWDELYARTPLRDHVELDSQIEIRHTVSDHKAHEPGSEGFAQANLLQLADLLLGSVIRSCFTGNDLNRHVPPPGTQISGNKKDIVAYPVSEMVQKLKRGRGMTHSGHYRAFTISLLTFSGGRPEFKRLDAKDVVATEDSLTLPFGDLSIELPNAEG